MLWVWSLAVLHSSYLQFVPMSMLSLPLCKSSLFLFLPSNDKCITFPLAAIFKYVKTIVVPSSVYTSFNS